MLSNTYALIRVSTKKQKEERQIKKMLQLGIPRKNIIVEKESGKSLVRTKYHRLVKKLKAGDILYIENIDRLSCDYDGIIGEWYKLTIQKGVTIKVLDAPMLDTDHVSNNLIDKFLRNILLHSQAYQSESEWDKLKDRQAQGFVVAKASGKKLGRPKKVITETEINTAEQHLSQEINLDTALTILDIKKSAFYDLLNVVKNI